MTGGGDRAIYQPKHAGWLVSPLRHLVMPPGRIVRRLQVRPADHVLEVGAGPGWFSPAVAQAIPHGRLVLFDLQRDMLDMAARRLRAKGCSNFELVEGDAARLPFPDAVFDVAFLVTVLAEVADRAACMRELWRVLKPGGRLSISEQLGDPGHVAFSELGELAAGAGFGFERRFGSALLYTASFRKPDVSA
jgi:ubiquinone/menaquinone biosynthesis C-methylase UbiE